MQMPKTMIQPVNKKPYFNCNKFGHIYLVSLITEIPEVSLQLEICFRRLRQHNLKLKNRTGTKNHYFRCYM